MSFPELPIDGQTPWGNQFRAWAAAIEASSVNEVSGVVTLPADGPRLRQLYTVGTATINGETFPIDTAMVARRTAAGTWQVAVVDGADWRAFNYVPDTTAPTAGALASSAITDTGFTLTVSGASDAIGLHAQPYAFSTNNGSTWSAWQSSASFDAAGLAPSTAYQARHKVRDAAGNESTGSAITVNTTATPLGGDIADDFTATDTVDMNGRATPVGAATWTTPWDMGLGPAAIGISSNRAYSTGNGAAKVTVTQQDLTLSCAYDVTTGSAQVRLFARAQDSGSEAANGVVIAIVTNTGAVKYQVGNATWVDLGTGAPTTGTLALECVGTVGKIFVNDVQVGADFTIPTGSRALAGPGVYGGGKADDFQVIYA